MGEVGIRLIDWFLLPIYLTLIIGGATVIRNQLYPKGHPWRRYFLPGLMLKLFGAVFLCCLYWYYYGEGDTTHYFNQSLVINEALTKEGLVKWFNLLLRIPDWYDSHYYPYISRLYWYIYPNNYQVSVIGAIFGIFTFNTYLNSSLFFAVLSYTGVWAMFRCFVKLFPLLTHQAAIATLFIPSLFFWGSGYGKDSICMFALGWAMYLSFELFYHRRLRLGAALLLLFSLYMLFIVKVYILVSLMPALLFWLASRYAVSVRHPVGRVLVRVILVSIVLAAVFILNKQFEQELRGYSLENLASTSEYMQYWQGSEESRTGGSGSFYSLGEFDPTLLGILKLFPQGVNVTLFRPYFWEAKKAIVLISALEAFIFLVITLKVLFEVGAGRFFGTVFRNVDAQFFLIFTLIFAFAIGVSTLNFGTLSRYKIPCMPTFLMALLIIYHADGNYSKRLFPRIRNFI